MFSRVLLKLWKALLTFSLKRSFQNTLQISRFILIRLISTTSEYNLGSNRARKFTSASWFEIVRFKHYSRDYFLNCTPLSPITFINYLLLLFPTRWDPSHHHKRYNVFVITCPLLAETFLSHQILSILTTCSKSFPKFLSQEMLLFWQQYYPCLVCGLSALSSPDELTEGMNTK